MIPCMGTVTCQAMAVWCDADHQNYNYRQIGAGDVKKVGQCVPKPHKSCQYCGGQYYCAKVKPYWSRSLTGVCQLPCQSNFYYPMSAACAG